VSLAPLVSTERHRLIRLDQMFVHVHVLRLVPSHIDEGLESHVIAYFSVVDADTASGDPEGAEKMSKGYRWLA
jgi:hypothetical protein